MNVKKILLQQVGHQSNFSDVIDSSVLSQHYRMLHVSDTGYCDNLSMRVHIHIISHLTRRNGFFSHLSRTFYSPSGFQTTRVFTLYVFQRLLGQRPRIIAMAVYKTLIIQQWRVTKRTTMMPDVKEVDQSKHGKKQTFSMFFLESSLVEELECISIRHQAIVDTSLSCGATRTLL